jgi:branched-chain amino acid transport system substrate-binding protein
MKKQLVMSVLVATLFGIQHIAIGAESGIKIGVMTDMSGGSSDLAGKGSVVAAQMAVEEFGGKVLGKPITVIGADHQAKADIATALARKWFDTEGVDMIIDLPHSSSALAVQDIARAKNKVSIVSTGATIGLTQKACSPTGFHWTYDTYSNSYPMVKELVRQGKDSWYYITVDYAFGSSLEADFRRAVTTFGGTNVGGTKHALNAADFSSQVMAAKTSKAKVVVLANAGNDLINGMKAAREFGLIKGGQTVIIPVAFLTDIKSLGLQAGQGLQYVDAFNTDLDQKSRDFVARYIARHKSGPSMAHIGVYSGVLHYLKGVQAAGSADGKAVADKMRSLPVNDAFVRNGKIRPDGRMIHDMYVVQVKSPAESKGPWDLVKYERVIPAESAFKPLSESECPLVSK